MKKNNRLISLIIALSLLAVTVGILLSAKGCADRQSTKRIISEFNQNASLPFALAISDDSLGDVSEYTYCGGFGCYALEKEGIAYGISGFPDVIDDYHITSVTLTSSAYAVYGIRTGDAYSESIEDIMRSFDFKTVKATDTNDLKAFGNDKLLVQFTLEENIITSIYVHLETTNKHKIVF